MLTIFSIPKHFQGHAAVIQTNAIQSWKYHNLKQEIILFGEEEGTKEITDKFHLRHISGIQKNEYGTPLISSLFSKAQNESSSEWLCYVNADIILMSDFFKAFKALTHHLKEFLMVGRRWDVDMKENLQFPPDWEGKLKAYVRQNGRLHAHTGIDYFVFPRGFYKEIPPFAIRGAWDCWLVYYACSMKLPVVDITKSAMVIHQNHDYSHVKDSPQDGWKGSEVKYNFALAGGEPKLFTLRDSQFELTKDGLIKRRDHLYSLYRWMVTYSKMKWLFIPFIRLIKSLRDRLRGWVTFCKA